MYATRPVGPFALVNLVEPEWLFGNEVPAISSR